MGLSEMFATAESIINSDTGYDQPRRLTFFNRSTKQVIPHKDADCSSFCAAVAICGGLDLPSIDNIDTGTFKDIFVAAGCTAIPFQGLGQVLPGDFVLRPKNASRSGHVEFVGRDGRFGSGTLNEFGGISGGQPGNQSGTETRWTQPYLYEWDWIIRPPFKISVPTPLEDKMQKVTFSFTTAQWLMASDGTLIPLATPAEGNAGQWICDNNLKNCSQSDWDLVRTLSNRFKEYRNKTV